MLRRFLALAALTVASLLIPLASATAQDSSPYVVGHWRLNDSFQDFMPGAAITTDNTDFVFLNPTGLTLTLEYAFFAAPDGTFCGCDRDTLKPNGRTRYTMSVTGWQRHTARRLLGDLEEKARAHPRFGQRGERSHLDILPDAPLSQRRFRDNAHQGG